MLLRSCVFQSSLALRLPRLVKREVIFAFRFVRFTFVWFGLYPLPLGVWEALWLVIVALPGLFSYFFYTCREPELRADIPGHNILIVAKRVRCIDNTL